MLAWVPNSYSSGPLGHFGAVSETCVPSPSELRMGELLSLLHLPKSSCMHFRSTVLLFDKKELEAGKGAQPRGAHRRQLVGLPGSVVNSASGPVYSLGGRE